MSLRPADAARDLRFWRAEQLRALERLLDQALRPWALDWGLDETRVWVRCGPAEEDDAAIDDTALRGDRGSMAWLGARKWAGVLVAELFGNAGGAGEIAREIEAACIEDASRRLALALGMRDTVPQESTSASMPRRRTAWCGDVRASLPFGGLLLLNAGAVEACLRRAGMPAKASATHVAPASLTLPLLQAAAGQRMGLRAQLAPCEVDLGVLQDLQPGDVLRIPHRIDAPLQVCSESGTPLFSGYLASSRGRKALELVFSQPEASLHERAT